MGKIICERCKKKCSGDVLRVSNRYFHKGCFTCTKCKKNLETGGFYMKDGGFYCQADYHRYFVAKCKSCSKDLIGELVTVLNYSFHRECFKCTNCSINFCPGDRVTVWNERFFCPSCIGEQCVQTSSNITSVQRTNGSPFSPLTVTDDEGCCVSVADGSQQEFPSPADSKPSPSIAGDKSVSIASVGEFRLRSSEAKCQPTAALPQQSKSILRKSGVDKSVVQDASRGHVGLSTDSGLGERVYNSRMLDEKSDLQFSTTNGIGYSGTPAGLTSATMSLNNSRQSLSNRVPNSDYGRFLNQSYMHLNGNTTPSDVGKYKRNVSFTNLYGSSGKLKHFHLPETKTRFLPPGTRTHALILGRQPTGQPSSPVRRIVPKQYASSAVELSRQEPTEQSTPNHDDARSHVNGNLEDEVTAEARRLACFPSGHKRDPNTPPPIERYDWPAPPASAVILAEMMRERRCKRKEQSRVNGTMGDETEDFESQDALSIDYSFDGAAHPTDATHIYQASGMGQAIMKEQASEQKRQSRLHQPIDPISASRSPNAAVEPMFKTRYSTHQFSSSGQPIKPGYTGGRLSENQKTSSLPASSLVLVNTSRLKPADSGLQFHASEDKQQQHTSRGLLSPASRPYYHSVHTLHTNHQTASTNLHSAGRMPNGCANSYDLLNSPTDGYPHVHYPTPPSAAFHNIDTPAPKVIPYEKLRTYRRSEYPRGVDRTALESYLSEEEFQNVFRLSRSAFYRLPEWKRNDLKRRVELF